MADFARTVSGDRAIWREVIRAAGIRAEQGGRPFMRRLILAALLASLPTFAPAQDLTPRILAGFGVGNLVARRTSEDVAPALGARPVVENRTGVNEEFVRAVEAVEPARRAALAREGSVALSATLPAERVGGSV